MRENKAVENVEYDNQYDKEDTTKTQMNKMMNQVAQKDFHHQHETLFGTIPENLHDSSVDTLVCLKCFLKIKYNHNL